MTAVATYFSAAQKQLLLKLGSSHIPRMKTCEYCGRKSPENASNCHECGTAFASEPISAQPEPDPPKVVQEVPPAELAGLEMGFEIVAGFSRPNWKAIRDFVRSHVAKENWSVAWDYIVKRWLVELAGDLGGKARVCQSRRFCCLSDANTTITRALLDYAEFVVESIREFLGAAAWRRYHGSHVLLVFSDLDDYYAYVSFYHRDGKHILSGGVFIRQGHAHIALPYTGSHSSHHVLAHELTHNLLCHLPIPLWLNEGLAMVLEQRVTGQGPVVDRELADRHRSYWNASNIQKFWAGGSFDVPGDESELSYGLGEILVMLLSEKRAGFSEFVRAADWRDAGQDAAVVHLGLGLEELAAEFLGPGDWRPNRKAIRDYWNGDESRRAASPRHP